MFKRTITSALIFGAAALGPPAHAEGRACAQRDTIVEALESRYDETLSGAGLQNAQQVLEVWSSPKTGSFTVIVTNPDGISCIVASGGNWHMVVEDAKEGVAG